MSDVIITADKTPWYQWDTGLAVTVSGGDMTECHFANRKQGTAYVQAVIKGKAKVPDELLQVAAPIKAYGYISDGGGGQTYVEQSFDVIARNIPSDYTYTKTAQKTIRDAETARDQAYAAANDILEVGNEVVGFKNEAKASADAAKKSAGSAEYQAGRAKTNADDAGVAMANAQSFAKMSSVHATESEGSAKKSAQSASAAASSASEASVSASEAATSASEAKTAAGNAASEVLAATKANADAAAQSATEAEAAKGEAATSASNAADSATAAAKSAGDAAARVDAINVIAPKTVDVAAVHYGVDSVAIGNAATCEPKGSYSVVIGSQAHGHTIGTVAIGPGARDVEDSEGQNVIIGDNANATSGVNGSVTIGAYSQTSKNGEFSVGHPVDASGAEGTREITHVSTPTEPSSAATKAYVDRINIIAPTSTNAIPIVTGENSVAIGGANNVPNVYSVAIGRDAFTSRDSEVSIGDPGTGTRYLASVRDPNLTHDAANKHYVDTTTSNALVGYVSGKLLHVEDAWPDKPLSLNINGAYKQDGTPSPENPVPITVIENPVLHITGRNLTNVPDMTVPLNDSNSTLFDCGLIPNGTTAYVSMVSSSAASPKFDDAASVGLSDGVTFVYSITPATVAVGVNKTTITPTFDATKHLRFYGYRQPLSTFEMSNYQLEVGGYHDYRPYTSAALPITLPAEHPYMAALPEGTSDEITVNSVGNVTLIARVGKVLVADQTISVHTTTTTTPYAVFNLIAPTGIAGALMCNTHEPVQYSDVSGTVYSPNGHDIVIRDSRFTSLDVVKELLADTVLYYRMTTPVTYSLGKLDISSLPETISNVWTGAELTTDMSMVYKRDVNAVIAGLNAQINALKSTVNEPPEVTDPTIE